MNCPICQIQLKNHKGMSYHFTIEHKLDYIKYLVERKLIEVPKCKYCENDIDVISKKSKGRQTVLNHPEELIYCSNDCKYKDDDYKKILSDNGKKGCKAITGANREKYKEENRKKVSVTAIKNWQNKEIRDKMVESAKEKVFTKEHKQNISNAMTGLLKTDEHKEKIRKTVVNRYVNGDGYGHKYKFFSEKNNKTVYLKSSYELKMAKLLEQLNEIKIYNYESIVLNREDGKAYIPDFYFILNKKHYLVEIDRYKGFKEKYGYGWKLELARQHCQQNGWTFLYFDVNDIDNFNINAYI